ncbi:MAG: phosphatase PAP2 family protein [Deltaproteobacteria bacterium]|nr:phosphatase PAP2 family protein [Deltaproteobacteria bacterium]
MKTKRSKIILIFFIIFNFAFSITAYAGDDIELAGNILQIVIPATAGSVALYKGDKQGIIQFSKSLLTTLGATYALKYTVNEKRPNGGSHGFPSGHTSAAFSGASFLQKRYGWEYGIPAYVGASFVGWSRIESNEHYWQDVLAGAAIGVISTYIFTDAYKKGIVATPLIGKKTIGLQLSLAF